MRSDRNHLPPPALLVLTLAAVLGCDRKAAVHAPPVTLQTTHKEVSPFEEAADMLSRLDEFQPEQARSQILFKLRQWSREQRPNVDWIADPLFRRIPSTLSESAERLESSDFDPFDAYVLMEGVWLRDLAQSICTRSIDDRRVLEGLKVGQLSAEEADDLGVVYRLFDWTVRNIQLDPELEDHDFLGGEKEKRTRDSKAPRHFYHAFENLLYSHGDWLERSRIVILMARQMGIPVVMVASERNEETRYWGLAASIGNELYLFDAGLGIPLPGKDGAFFGKVSDYLDQPGLLNDLTSDDAPYHFTSTDLDYLTALIDATPAHLSQRMKFVETRLEGKAKMSLTVAPSPLASKLRGCRGINSVGILLIPYQAYQFARHMQQLSPQEQMSRMGKLADEQRPFLFRGPVYQGRLLHFRGNFRGDEVQPGATKFYMDARVPQRELDQLDIPYAQLPPDAPILADLPKALPNEPPPNEVAGADPAYLQRLDALRELIYQQKADMLKKISVQSKQLVTFWLGLVAMENQDYRVAIDFFEKIVKQDQESPFVLAATYNLARCHEMRGMLENSPEETALARELYLADTTPQQRTGSRIRAQRLVDVPSSSANLP